MPATPELVARVRALMARASDPGASEEEQRTSAHIAAKLCKQHGLTMGGLGDDGAGVVTTRAEVVIGGVRTIVETISAGRAGLDAALGFDVFAFAQGLLRERAQEAMKAAIVKPAPAARARKVRKRSKR